MVFCFVSFSLCRAISQCFVPFPKIFVTKHVFKLKTVSERGCFSSVREGDRLVTFLFSVF